MLYVAAFSVCLSLCYLPFAELGGFVLCVIIVVLGQFLPAKEWRYLTWSALLGVIVAFMASAIYTRIRVGGIGTPTYASNARIAAIHDPLRPYLFPLGAFGGGSIGMLLYKRQSLVAVRDERVNS
ncbi:MAG: hypothetical protein C0485_15675 [Pirellula sp.]|nr:hypothetical protein [Pirellula sp.]